MQSQAHVYNTLHRPVLGFFKPACANLCFSQMLEFCFLLTWAGETGGLSVISDEVGSQLPNLWSSTYDAIKDP